MGKHTVYYAVYCNASFSYSDAELAVFQKKNGPNFVCTTNSKSLNPINKRKTLECQVV